MRLILSAGLVVLKKMTFPDNIFGVNLQLKFENISKPLLFDCLSFSKTLLFCSFIIFERTHGTSRQGNYIYMYYMNGLLVI